MLIFLPIFFFLSFGAATINRPDECNLLVARISKTQEPNMCVWGSQIKLYIVCVPTELDDDNNKRKYIIRCG